MIKGVVRLVVGGNMSIKKLAALVLSGVLCLTAFTGCGASNDEVIATLGEEEVSFGVANFICKYQQAMVEDTYRTWFGTDDIWSLDLYGNGSTLGTDMKNSVMESLHDLYTLKAHMGDYGVTITAEDEKAIDAAVAAFMAANSSDALDEMSGTEEVVKEVLTLYTIQAKMYDAIISKADTEVSDEEANMRGFSIIEVYLDGYYDDSYNFVEYTEQEVAELKETVAAMDLALDVQDMDAVAEEYGMTIYTDAYAADDEELDEALKTALDAMEVGDVSDVIEVGDALYFVRLDTETDEKATEENRLAIIEERQLKLYEETVTGWQLNDGWTVNADVLAKIEFRNILTMTPETTESTQTSETEGK